MAKVTSKRKPLRGGRYKKILLSGDELAHEAGVLHPQVESLAKLFADAADDKLEDKKLAQRLNAWLPTNLRDQGDSEGSTARSCRK